MTPNRVREFRQAAGLTLEQLAQKTGMPLSTISDIERGAMPRVLAALRLAEVLDTTVEKLWKV